MIVSLGIDPGLSGGVAAICSERGLLEASRLPAMPIARGSKARVVDARALRLLLSAWSAKHDFAAADDVVLVVERMTTFGGPNGGKDNAPRGTLLSMGHSAGLVEGVATAFTRRTLRPLPQQWKGVYGLVIRRTKLEALALPDEKKSERKARSVRVAQLLYPTMGRAVHDIAEAVLLAHFGLGELTPIVSAKAQGRREGPQPGDADDPFAVPATEAAA